MNSSKIILLISKILLFLVFVGLLVGICLNISDQVSKVETKEPLPFREPIIIATKSSVKFDEEIPKFVDIIESEDHTKLYLFPALEENEVLAINSTDSAFKLEVTIAHKYFRGDSNIILKSIKTDHINKQVQYNIYYKDITKLYSYHNLDLEKEINSIAAHIYVDYKYSSLGIYTILIDVSDIDNPEMTYFMSKNGITDYSIYDPAPEITEEDIEAGTTLGL